MTAQTSKPRKLSQQQEIISLFLIDKKNINWPNEMRVATKLIKEYGFDWLMSLYGRTKTISLTWFLGENGKKFLNDIKKQDIYTNKKWKRQHQCYQYLNI